MKCPHCQENIDVRLIKAPANAQPSTRPAGNGAVSGDLGELIQAAEDQPMTTWEETFYADLKARYAQWKDRTKVSDKQMAILRKIASGEGGRNDEF